MRIHRARILVSCIGLAAAAAGCGGSGPSFKSDFQKQVPVINQLDKDIGNALQSASGKNNSQLEAEFNGLSKRARSELSQLGKLKPDSRSASSFGSAQSGLAKVEQDLGAIAASARANSPTAAKSATETLIVDATFLKGASDQLKNGLGIKTIG